MYLLPLSRLDVEENSATKLVLKRSRVGSVLSIFPVIGLSVILLYEVWDFLFKAHFISHLVIALSMITIVVLLNFVIFGDTIRFDKASGDIYRNNRLWFKKGGVRKLRIHLIHNMEFKDFSSSDYILKIVTSGYAIEHSIEKYHNNAHLEFLAETIEEATGVQYSRKDDYYL